MNKAKATRKKAILIVGMHRSGTSALTRVLNLLGVDLGQKLLNAGNDNRLGFWEHADAVAVHEKLLIGLNRSWHDTRALPNDWEKSPAAREAKRAVASLITREFSHSPLWAVKDPRLCRLAPLWVHSAKELGIDLHVLFAVRSPGEVIDSLNVRDGLEPETVRLSWLEHFMEAEYLTRGIPRSLVLYEDLLADWRVVVKKVAADFDIRWPKTVNGAASSIDAFIDKGERHHVKPSISSTSSDAAENLFEACVSYAHGTVDWAVISELVDSYWPVAKVFLADIDKRSSAAAESVSRLEQTEEQLKEKESRIVSLSEQSGKWERQVFGLLETVHGKDAQIGYRDESMRAKEGDIHRRDEIIGNKEARIAVLDEGARRRDDQIEDRNETIRERERQITALNEAIQNQATLLGERDEVIRSKAAQLNAVHETMQHKDALLDERDEAIRGKDVQISALNEANQHRADLLGARDEIIRTKDAQLKLLDEATRTKDALVSGRDEVIRGKDAKLSALDEAAKNRDALLAARDEVIESNAAKMTSLGQALHEKSERVEELAREVDARGHHVDQLSQQVAVLQVELDDMEGLRRASETLVAELKASSSWRITKPLRAIKSAMSPKGAGQARKQAVADRIQESPLTLHEPDAVPDSSGAPEITDPGSPESESRPAPKESTVPLVEEAIAAPDQGMDAALDEPAASATISGLALKQSSVPIPILSTPHCGYVANGIKSALERAGIPSRVMLEVPEEGFDDVPHFVVCPQMFDELPGLYVAFQMEQSVSSRWFTDDYLRRLECSFAILDYSLVNIEFLQKRGLHAKQLYHVPIGHLPDYMAPDPKIEPSYDVLFYGDIENDRRKRFIAELGKVCTVKVHNSLFGSDLHSELARARLVVNIHYYEGALLETTRLWECVSLGKLVVSERSADMDQNHDLAQLVDFVDTDDVGAMVGRVQYWLKHEERFEQRLQENKEYLERTTNQFDYHFYRFLLATDNIDFEKFWSLIGCKTKLPGDKLCLNLPEYVARSQSFDRDNSFGFVRFTGLRHDKGWIGCALSYKLMMRLARQEGLDMLAVCEDDVEFSPDFDSRWPRVQAHLAQSTSEWDVFSGLMANLHEDARVVQTCEKDGVRYIETDRLISMVFNVYGKKIFDVADTWNDSDRDENTNTIDRYLEGQNDLRVLTTAPFLVGHKEDLHSTLWGFQNSQYSVLIAESDALMSKKLRSHLEHKSSALADK